MLAGENNSLTTTCQLHIEPNMFLNSFVKLNKMLIKIIIN